MARLPKKVQSWDRFIKVPDLIHPDYADHNVRVMFKRARIEAQVSIAKVARKLRLSDGAIWDMEEGVKPIPEFVALNWSRVLLIRFKDFKEAYLKDTSARLNIAERDGVDKWQRSPKTTESNLEALSPPSSPDTESLPKPPSQT